MAYVLRKENRSKGIYLQIYFSFRDPDSGKPRQQHCRTLGYVDNLVKGGIPDPISFYTAEVNKMNSSMAFNRVSTKSKMIGAVSPLKHLGYFPLQAILRRLDVRKDIDNLQLSRRFHYSVFECMSALIFARACCPASKLQTAQQVLPSLYENFDFNYETIRSCLEFIGSHYQKIIEIFTAKTDYTYILNTSHVLFDCTNFYFEIDNEDELRRKGPSKENRKDPIVGMGLLLDSNCIPLGMKIYPGNQSEQPVLREIIHELKAQSNIKGRTIQVADKGLNSSKNIIAAIDHGDGYILSKSVKKLKKKEQDWVLRDNDYEEFFDEKGYLKYKLKSEVKAVTYEYSDDNGRKVTRIVTEKHIVTFNPKLRRKQIYELNKMIEKAESLRLSEARKSEYGAASKYVDFVSQDGLGEINGEKAVIGLNEDKIKRDRALAGYNMLVTSEVNQEDKRIYDQYHELWRIEETFRCTKSEIEARPVYVQDENRIKGHFLICYLVVLLERLFQFKVLENEFGSEKVYDFIRDFCVIEGENKCLQNVSVRTPLIEFPAQKYSLPLLYYRISRAQVRKVLERSL